MPEKSLHYKIALLIPCYNAESYIDNFITHINKLPEHFDEVIFYNDGSTDNTLNLLKESGYKYISSDFNKGPGYARNRLAEATVCDYIHFHDVDDVLEPIYLNGVKPFISGDYDAILCDADWVDPVYKKTVIKWEYKNELLKREGPAYLLLNPVGGINGLYKKATFLAIGGFDESLRIWEDSDLNLRLALTNKRIMFTENVLVTSIRHNNTLSSDNSRIRQNKISFLYKHINVADEKFQQQLIIEANKLYHEIVYNKDWPLYNSITKIFKANKLVPPVTNNLFASLLKKTIGSKTFTNLKLFYLKKFLKMKI